MYIYIYILYTCIYINTYIYIYIHITCACVCVNECILVSLFCLAEYVSILILMYILDLVVEPPFENLKVIWGDHHFIFRNGREKMCETGNQRIWSLKITLDYSRFKSLIVWILLFTIPNSDKINHCGIYIPSLGASTCLHPLGWFYHDKHIDHVTSCKLLHRCGAYPPWSWDHLRNGKPSIGFTHLFLEQFTPFPGVVAEFAVTVWLWTSSNTQTFHA